MSLGSLENGQETIVTVPASGGGPVFTYMGCPIAYGFSAVLVRMKVSIWAILVSDGFLYEYVILEEVTFSLLSKHQKSRNIKNQETSKKALHNAFNNGLNKGTIL